MKKYLVLLFVLIIFKVEAQYISSINIGAGKTTSAYRYFALYKGGVSSEINLNYKIWKYLYFNAEYNYGHIYNDFSYKANFNNFSTGIQVNFLMHKKINLNYYFGIGYEFLNLKSNVYNDNIELNGLTYINSLQVNYNINKKIATFIRYKIQQSDMKKNIDFSELNFYHRTRFGSASLGIKYKLYKTN